ncbi:hypothetical protein AB0H92_34810, partial [Streptomyces phaeochromogenes]
RLSSPAGSTSPSLSTSCRSGWCMTVVYWPWMRAAEAAAEAAMAAAPVWQPEPEPAKELPPPGMWVEAFMAGLKRDPDPNAFTRNPDDPTASTASTVNNEPARTDADDEGDLK